MMGSIRLVWIIPFGLWAAVFGLRRDPDDFLRRAHAAYISGDLEAAVQWCEQAEDRTHDPGLVAFNKAAALYHIGEYHQAELHYRRCLEDAQGSRLTGALYNLGNCLAKESDGTNRRLLLEAIRFYGLCLEAKDIEAGMVADARYNLELAKLLLESAKKSGAREETDSTSPPDETHPPRGRNGNDSRLTEDDRRRGTNPRGPADSARPNQTQEIPSSREMLQPGKGNLPPIPDDSKPVGLSAEEAREYLQKAADRIRAEHREHRRRSRAAMPANAKDW
jgi:tetratricopeptide (TPR) repeat protein